MFDRQKFSTTLRAHFLKVIAAEDRRIALREFGVRSGVSAATLSRIENGGTPDIDTFFRLCKWMGVSGDDFLVG